MLKYESDIGMQRCRFLTTKVYHNLCDLCDANECPGGD